MFRVRSAYVSTEDPKSINDDTNNNKNKNNGSSNQIGEYRVILPQVIACLANFILLFQIGLILGFPTIVIPALRGLQTDKYPEEYLELTASESSWYGSTSLLAQPFGSFFSGWLTERVGRKKAMMCVAVPHVIGWLLSYFAESTVVLFIGAAILGLGIGLLEAAAVTYVSEICQPSLRGRLTALCNVGAMFGFSTVFFLGSITKWRTAALVCGVVPMCSALFISQMPETPYWLVSKHRYDEARKALQWLRGWVEPNVIEPEFLAIQRYRQEAVKCKDCQSNQQFKCEHVTNSSFIDKLKMLCSLGARRPFFMLMFVFFLVCSNGMSAIRTFMVQIVRTFGVPIDPNWVSVIIGISETSAYIICSIFVKIFGKRAVFIFSIAAASLFNFLLGLNAYLILPSGTKSFFEASQMYQVDHENYYALIMIISLALLAGIGAPLPWVLFSEILPYRIRGVATGIAGACIYLLFCIATKTFFNLDELLSMSGCFFYFSIVCAIGCVITYVILPETENKTLEEIEMFFSDRNRKITDHHIRKISVLPSPIGNKETQSDQIHSTKL